MHNFLNIPNQQKQQFRKHQIDRDKHSYTSSDGFIKALALYFLSSGKRMMQKKESSRDESKTYFVDISEGYVLITIH